MAFFNLFVPFLNLFAVFLNLLETFFNLFAAFFSLFAAFINLLGLFLNLSVLFFNVFPRNLRISVDFYGILAYLSLSGADLCTTIGRIARMPLFRGSPDGQDERSL